MFRRLKWLNEKMASQAITLMFLALWHGYHLGYFVIFALEMACIVAEQQVLRCPNLYANASSRHNR